ncbi:MAG: hypothetical protein JWN25_1016 [Verrucomicrobiales bacterium]|nr:hypothetical protein [Verrucomicrobiales bacterium]
MFRKHLLELLLKSEMSANQVARAMDEKTADVVCDLDHLLKSLRHTEYKAVIKPALCRKCGYVFGESKLSKPARCPECKATWLQEPLIKIVSRK